MPGDSVAVVIAEQAIVKHAGRHGDDHHRKTVLKVIVEKTVELAHVCTSFLDICRGLYYTIFTNSGFLLVLSYLSGR